MNTQFFKDLALPFYGYNQPGTWSTSSLMPEDRRESPRQR